MFSHEALSFAEKSPVSLISVCPCFHNRLIQEYMQYIYINIYIYNIYILYIIYIIYIIYIYIYMYIYIYINIYIFIYDLIERDEKVTWKNGDNKKFYTKSVILRVKTKLVYQLLLIFSKNRDLVCMNVLIMPICSPYTNTQKS